MILSNSSGGRASSPRGSSAICVCWAEREERQESGWARCDSTSDDDGRTSQVATGEFNQVPFNLAQRCWPCIKYERNRYEGIGVTGHR